MPEIRQYQIPYLGCFGITHLEKTLVCGPYSAEPGYYGTKGAGFVTPRFNDLESAEKGLVQVIKEAAIEEQKRIDKEIRLSKIKRDSLSLLIEAMFYPQNLPKYRNENNLPK